MRNMITALVVILGLVCGPLAAQESNGTPYLTGGVGDEELQQINQASRDFNLKLLLTAKSGEYLADVAVAIFNAKGVKVLDVGSAGPLLLARLPPGAYRVSASYQGRETTKRVNLRAGGPQTLVFAW